MRRHYTFKAKQNITSCSFNKSIKSDNGNRHIEYRNRWELRNQQYDTNHILKTILKIMQTFIISDFYIFGTRKN